MKSFIYHLIHRLLRLGGLVGIVLIIPNLLLAQQKDSSMTGNITGKVKDSIYNFMLTSATVAVYTDADSSLLQFSLPNNFGEFAVQSLPVGKPLRLIITHTGYKAYFKRFTLEAQKPTNDFGLLYMHQDDEAGGKALEEVIVKAVPPVRMNGDTLEFNADAFRMDANATGEDWMRILPGLTIWGDGEITFNGKKINALLVDGKPFMGGETTVATQNLPKEALEKLQIYQQRDEKNPLDSTMFANLKLKEDKKMGYFGKVSGGYGTDRRYTADGMLSGFNKKLQVNAVGAVNNINKVANGVDVLMKSSSYKGEGLNMDYQSNFNMRGLNRPFAAGVKIQYDFIPDPQYQKSSRLNADYFINDNRTDIVNNTLSNNFLSADTILSRNTASRSQNYSTDQRFSSTYALRTEKISLNLNAALTDNYDNSMSESNATQEKTGLGIIGATVANNTSQTRRQGLAAGVDYTRREAYNSYNQQKRIPSEFTLGYKINTMQADGNARNATGYTSRLDPATNRTFDRFYEQRDENLVQHIFSVSYPGLRRLIFNRKGFGGVEMALSGTYTTDNNNYYNKVLDKDTVTRSYRLNNYLTNDRNARSQNFIPVFTASKTFYKGLTNRYNKWLSLRADFKNQYFAMQHSATQAVQNFSYQYSKFIPTAAIEYYNHQYGSYEARYNLNYTTGVTYPGVNNIAPLVDSSNIWYIPKGNPFIKPQYKQELAFTYRFNTRTSKNPLQVDFNAGIGSIKDNITDSTLYDDEGVRTVYAVNTDGNRFVNGGIGVKKSMEFNKKKTTLEVTAKYDVTKGQNPEYINSILNLSNNLNQSMNASISYRQKDVLNLRVEHNIGFYVSEQQGFNNSRFKSANQATRFLAVLQMPKSLSWATNITYNKSTANNTQSVNFTIWNASFTYRFLKGNQGEVKFSALDLLRQNKGIINTSRGNTQTFTTTNVLQQYYMLTLSYYPRKFGKTPADKD